MESRGEGSGNWDDKTVLEQYLDTEAFLRLEKVASCLRNHYVTKKIPIVDLVLKRIRAAFGTDKGGIPSLVKNWLATGRIARNLLKGRKAKSTGLDLRQAVMG